MRVRMALPVRGRSPVMTTVDDLPANRRIRGWSEQHMLSNHRRTVERINAERAAARSGLLDAVARWHLWSGHCGPVETCAEPVCAAAHPSVLR